MHYLQSGDLSLPEDLIIVLGPTASGKTKLAVAIAKELDAEIISADSRQVYRRMDIGTGKDIHEYGTIPYHLIDIVEPGEKYNISRFLEDFEEAYHAIKSRNKPIVVSGGTGFYIQTLLEPKPYTQVPINLSLREEFDILDRETLRNELQKRVIPAAFKVDFSSKKRMIRALEILDWITHHPTEILNALPTYSAKIIGIDPGLEVRRRRISDRLRHRLANGMIEEVEKLLEADLTYNDLEYYGLEYKFISYYLQGQMTYDEFVRKLEIEIHRYAKR